MPIPRTVGRWNKVGLNRITRRIAPWLPGFGVVEHRGRRSGRRYRTPVNVFATEGGYRFALTYGPDTDWVKNVLAAGGCELRTRGRTIRLVAPRLDHDERRQGIRPLERQILRLLGVADFLSLRAADQPEAEARSGLPARPSASRRPTPGRARPRTSRAS
jgi:deazaflavin-dependent oxidoreductase (nitroreductase family)